jgi:hypothetical protein
MVYLPVNLVVRRCIDMCAPMFCRLEPISRMIISLFIEAAKDSAQLKCKSQLFHGRVIDRLIVERMAQVQDVFIIKLQPDR